MEIVTEWCIVSGVSRATSDTPSVCVCVGGLTTAESTGGGVRNVLVRSAEELHVSRENASNVCGQRSTCSSASGVLGTLSNKWQQRRGAER